MASDLVNDKVRLLRLIDLAPGHKIKGRIKLQKIVYLVQQLTGKFDYDFSYYTYGPFDKSVGVDVTWIARETGLIDESPPNDDQIPWEYTSKLDDRTRKELPKDSELFGEDETVISEKIHELANQDYRTLEVTATIVYLVNNMKYPSSDQNKIIDKLRELKPHLDSFYKSGIDLAQNYFKKEVKN